MAVVGSAEVIVRAITKQVKRDIQKAFQDARPIVAKEGDTAGREYSQAFGRSLNTNLSKEVTNAARSASSAIKRELGDAAESAGDDAGRRGGRRMASSFGETFRKDLIGAISALATLSSSFDLLAPAIAGVVGMISALVSGLYAVVAAAGQAVGALAVLPGLVSVLGQAFAAVKLGFGGVGAAIQAGTKAQLAATSAAGSGAKAAGVNTAAIRDLQEAQDALTAAQKEARAAQDALNAAQDRAKAGAEEQAQAEARLAAEQQNRSTVLADPNASATQGADVQKGVDDAQQALTTITRAREDAADAVTTAAERNEKAQAALLAAQKARDAAQKKATAAAASGLTGASLAAAKYGDALARLTPQAQEFVKQVFAMKAAFKEVGDAIAVQLFPPLTQALNLIGDSRFFNILKDNLSTTGGIVGQIGLQLAKAFTTNQNMDRFQELLKGNNDILDTLITTTEDGTTPMQSFVNILLKLGIAIQPITKRFAEWTASLITAFDASHDVEGLTGFFNRAGDSAAQLGRIFGNLFGALGSLNKAARPAGQGLVDSFEKATEKLDVFLKKPAEQKKLTQFFHDTADNMRAISDLLVLITGEFLSLGDNKGVGTFAKSLEPAVKITGDIADKLTTGDLGKKMGELATSVAELINTFTQSGQMEVFIDTLTDIINAITGITKVILQFPGVGSILAFLAVIRAFRFASKILGFSKSFDALAASVGKAAKAPFTELKKKMTSATDGAAVRAQTPATPIVPVGAVGTTSKLGGAVGKLGGAFRGFGKSLSALVGGPIGLILISLFLLFKGFQKLYKSSPEFKKFVDSIVNAIKPVVKAIGGFITNVLDKLFGWINDHMPQIKMVFNTAFGAIGQFITAVVIPVFNKLTPVFALLWGAVKLHFALIKGAWDLILKPVFNAIWTVAKSVFNAVGIQIGIAKNVMSAVFGAMKAVWEAVLRPVFNAIKSVARTAFSGVVSAVHTMRDAFSNAKSVISKAKDGLITVFNAIKSAARTPIKFIIDTIWNKGLVAMADHIPGVDASGWKVNTKGWATGGWTGPGSKYQPAGIVHADEFVVKKASRRAVEKMHPGLLDYLNRMGRLPDPRGYADGGRVTLGTGRRHTSGYPWADWAGDFPNPSGTPVWAWKKGIISEIHRWATSYGNHIRMKHTDGSRSLYAHLSKILVSQGQKVSQGTRIGNVGWTGNVRPKSPAGSHLHFEKQGGGGGFLDGLKGFLGSTITLGGKAFDWAGNIVKGGIKWTASKATAAYNGAVKFIKFISGLPDSISKNLSSAWGQKLKSIPKGAANKVVDKINSIVPHELPLIPIKHPFDNVDFRAQGGRVRKGAPYVVGELRPELFIPDSNGMIMPNLSRLTAGNSLADILKQLATPGRELTSTMEQTTQNSGHNTLNVNINNPAPERSSQSVAKAIRSKAAQHGWSV